MNKKKTLTWPRVQVQQKAFIICSQQVEEITGGKRAFLCRRQPWLLWFVLL